MFYLQELLEGFRIALRAINSNKLRSILTTLGIVIGITSVTAMATVINGIEKNFDDQMAELGADVLYIEKWPWNSGPGFKWWNYINRPDITADLAAVIAERSRYAVAAVPVVGTNRAVRFAGKTLSGVNVEGSSAAYPMVYVVDLEAGRFYSDIDERSARNVAVIGAQIASELFPVEEPVGKFIRISGIRFQVIGVLVRKGSDAEGQGGSDMQIKIPISAFKNHFGLSERRVSVRVKGASSESVEMAKDEVTGIVRAARKQDAFGE